MTDAEYEENGCTCNAGHAPCGWCENAPDPDSEAGLRREVRRLESDLHYVRGELRRLRDAPPSDANIAREREEMRRQAALQCLAVALACVAHLPPVEWKPTGRRLGVITNPATR